MSRIFLSHAGVQKVQAIALKQWLVEQNPPLDNDIFLDVDPRNGIQPGEKWEDVIQERGEECQVMICLVSNAWDDSAECKFEFAVAKRWGKRVLAARLEDNTGQRVSDYQWVDLFGGGPQTEIKVEQEGEDEPTTVTFPTRGLRRLRDAVIGHSMGAETFVWPPPMEKGRAPYRGWAALDEFDAAVFFGRDAQILRALDALREMRKSEEDTLFVILGPSGAGKSSFLRAGLLPRLRRDDTNYLVLDIVRPESRAITGDKGLAASIHAALEHYRIGQRPLGEIKRACLEDADQVGRMLHDIQQAAVLQLGEPPDSAAPVVVLPVDQAEELFGLDAGPEAKRFLELIERYARTDIAWRVPLIIAVTIRTDHVDALQTAPQLNAVRSVVFDDLKPMPEAEFKEVIEGPARRATQGGRALEIDPELVERLLVDDTKGADTLPLLALTLARLYTDYGADGRLGLSEYIAMGEMAKVVQTEIEQLLSQNEATRRRELELLRAAFIPHLATINPDNDQPVRRVARWDEFDDEVKPLLNKFVEKRLLVKDSRDTGDVVEVALESLLLNWDELKRWLDEEARDLKTAELLKREAATWEASGRADDYLLRGRRLEEAVKLLKRSDYEKHIASAREFVGVSKHHVRRRRTLVQAAVAVVVIAALVATVVLGMLAQARKQTAAFRLLKEAEQMLEGSRPGGDVRALQQILAALKLSPDAVDSVPDIRRDETKILENPPPVDTEGPTTTAVRSVAISPDGNHIAWASDDGVRVWDAQTNDIRTLSTAGDCGSSAVAYSRNGKWLAAAGCDQTVLLLDANSLDTVAAPMKNSGAVLSISFDPDSTSIATGADDGTVRVWDTNGHQRFTRLATHAPKTEVDSVAFTPDGQFVVSGGGDHTVRLWNAKTGEEARPPFADPAEDDTVYGVAVSPDGGRVIVGRSDGTMQLLDAHTLERRSPTIQAHPNDIESVAYSPDGTRIITGGGDNTVRIWDSETLTRIGSPLIGHHGTVQSVIYSLDGSRIVSGGFDGSVRIWDAVAGVPMPARNGAEIRAVAFSPDGTQVALGGTDGTITMWEARTGRFIRQLGQPCKAFDCSINSVAFDPQRPRLVSGATTRRATGEVRIWDLANPGQSARLEMPIPPDVPTVVDGRVKSVTFTPIGSANYLLAAVGWDGVVRLWDAQEPVPQLVATARAHATKDGQDVTYQVQSVAFSPDGSRLATGSGPNLNDTNSNYNYLQLWKVDLSPVPRLIPDGDPIEDSPGWDILGVAFDHKGERVVSSGFDGTVRVFEVSSHKRLKLLSSDQNPVLSLAFAHDHPWLVTGAADGKVRLWDIDTYQPIGTPLTGHLGWVYSVAVSPNDEWILSGSGDQTARLWSSPTDLIKSICAKLTANMSHQQWKDWVAQGNPLLRYEQVCPDLPVPKDK